MLTLPDVNTSCKRLSEENNVNHSGLQWFHWHKSFRERDLYKVLLSIWIPVLHSKSKSLTQHRSCFQSCSHETVLGQQISFMPQKTMLQTFVRLQGTAAVYLFIQLSSSAGQDCTAAFRNSCLSERLINTLFTWIVTTAFPSWLPSCAVQGAKYWVLADSWRLLI